MTKRTVLPFVGLLFLLSMVNSSQAGETISLRPYLNVGYLLTPPSAEDLRYVEVGGGNLDRYLDVNRGNFGGGLQFLLSPSKPLMEGMNTKLGLDIGVKRLFSSKFQAYENAYHKETEYDLSSMGLVELAPEGSPFFLQAGVGVHFVFWWWEYNFRGKYSSEYKEDSGMDTNVGLSGTAGMNLPIGEKLHMPIMVRVEHIFRYGSTAMISAMVGLDFGH